MASMGKPYRKHHARTLGPALSLETNCITAETQRKAEPLSDNSLVSFVSFVSFVAFVCLWVGPPRGARSWNNQDTNDTNATNEHERD